MRIICLVCIYIFFLLIFFLICRFSLNKILYYLKQITPFYQNYLKPSVNKLLNQLSFIVGDKSNDFSKNIIATVNKNLNLFAEKISLKLTSAVASFTVKLPKIIASFFIIVISSFFICADFTKITNAILNFFGNNFKECILKFKNVFFKSLSKLFYCEIILIFITFLQLLLGFYLLKIKNPLIYAALISFADVLPMLGVGTFLLPWAVVAYIDGKIALAIGILCLFFIVITVKSILEPKIIGKNMGIHPLVTIISMYVGAKIMGFAGILLVPFLPVFIKSIKEVKPISKIKRGQNFNKNHKIY